MDSFLTRLESLECHFTWNLSVNVSILHRQQENLEDRRRHGCTWEGHLYNLLGYIVYQISKPPKESLVYLREAEAVLREQEADKRGPRLLVNQANLAWVHYLQGELPECQDYLNKVAQLQKDFLPPPGCDLHPEVYGEKGWTQVKFDLDVKKEAIANFEMALRGDPDRAEWIIGLTLAKYKVHFDNVEDREEIIQQITFAKTIAPDNFRMSILYLSALADVGRKTEESVIEVCDFIHQLQPDLDGLGDILHFLRLHDSPDSALSAAEEVVRTYPSERIAKKELALCYKWKIFKTQGNLDDNEVKRGIALYEEVIRLYPHYPRAKIDLAGIYAKSGNIVKADEIFTDLLNKSEELEPGALQLLYNRYGSHLYKFKQSHSESIDYHKKAAEISKQSRNRKASIAVLRLIVNCGRHPRCNEIQEFLSKIQG